MVENDKSTILGFVASRPDGTTCPSEVARSLAKDRNTPLEWYKFIPVVRER